MPQNYRDAMTARYGAHLEGLVPPDATGRELVESILDAAVDAELRQRLGPIADKGVGALATWVAGLMRREINQTMARLLLASEQLDRLTIDGGLRPVELSLAGIEDSLSRRDRQRGRATRALHSAAALLPT